MEKEKMYELKSKAKIQLNKLKDEMMKKKKQGLSHFVEILIAILVAIAVGGVFMVLSNDAQTGHRKFARQDDAQHHGAAHTIPQHIDKGHGGQQLVSQRVGKLAEIRDHVPLACQMAVQKVGKAGSGKHDACQQVEGSVKITVHDAVQTGQGHKDHEHRHQNDAGQGKFIGQIHRFYPPIRYFTTVPYRS